MSFQENLKEYREKAGYKAAKDFAAVLGIPYSTYVAYENRGREPKYETLVKIAKALGVTPNDLLGYTGSVKVTFKRALRDLRASGFYDDYDEQVKDATALGQHLDFFKLKFNVFVRDDWDSETEFCFRCSPDFLISAYNFVHSNENETAFNSVKFGLYIKAFFYNANRVKQFKQELLSGFEGNSSSPDSSLIEKNGTRPIASSLEELDNSSK